MRSFIPVPAVRRLAALAVPVALAAACSKGGEQDAATQQQAPAAAPTAAHATIVDTAGKTIGEATFTQGAGGVTITVAVAGLTEGTHGIHIHTSGVCDPPAFAGAGGHFNPGGKKHGLENPEGPHAGDLPNFTVTAGDSAHYTTTTDRVALDAGPNGLLDADGSALVIHSGPDDNKTDPAGNSGVKVACGVITKS